MQSNSNLRRVIGALAACILFAAGAAQAAKAPKVDICHFDAEEGIFKPISVNGNAVRKHVEKHGDRFPNVDPPDGGLVLDEDCLGIITLPPYVFARAYIDVNKNQNYEGETDIDIAYVEDVNNNGILEIGDQIIFSQYPLNFDPCPAGDCSAGVGNFSAPPTLITAIEHNSPTQLSLNVSQNGYSLFDITFTNDATTQSLYLGGVDWCELRDDVRNTLPDRLRIDDDEGTCLAIPESRVNLAFLDPADGYFLQIQFYPDQP
jgi:hypothetical protein